MVRFLHTADWHLGIGYRRLGPKAEIARTTRTETVRRLMKHAKESGVDFVVVAGDLFDDNDVDRRYVGVVVNAIEIIKPIRAYILPGNHDPLRRDSPYMDDAWDSCENAVVLKDRNPVKIPGLGISLYPCPVFQKRTRDDPTAGIDAPGERISIGVAHGNLEIEGFVEDTNFPIDSERAEKSGLDYLALGEWHSLYKHKGVDGVVRTVYPGTPETTKFGEENSGKAVIVEIRRRGAKPKIEEFDIGSLVWKKWDKEVSSIDDVKHIEAELLRMQNAQDTLVNLTLRGVVDQDALDGLEELERKLSDVLFFFEVDREDLHLKPDLTRLKTLIPEGAIVDSVAKAIQALMKRHPRLQGFSEISSSDADRILGELGDMSSAQNASPETVERALLLLYQAAREASQ